MMLVDTNVMIYAHRLDAGQHAEYRAWMDALIAGPEPYAVSDWALNGVVRIVTNRRIYENATPTLIALNYAETIRDQPHAQVLGPGARFWPILRDLCLKVGASGTLVPDAYLVCAGVIPWPSRPRRCR